MNLLTTGRWFSPGPPVSSTNKTDRHDITELLLRLRFVRGLVRFAGGGYLSSTITGQLFIFNYSGVM
jgi:hypothetical protein